MAKIQGTSAVYNRGATLVISLLFLALISMLTIESFSNTKVFYSASRNGLFSVKTRYHAELMCRSVESKINERMTQIYSGVDDLPEWWISSMRGEFVHDIPIYEYRSEDYRGLARMSLSPAKEERVSQVVNQFPISKDQFRFKDSFSVTVVVACNAWPESVVSATESVSREFRVYF